MATAVVIDETPTATATGVVALAPAVETKHPLGTGMPMLSHVPPMHPIFMIDFVEGSTARQFFDFLEPVMTTIPLAIGIDGVFIERGNNSQRGSSMVVKAFIRAMDLINYHVDETQYNQPEYKRHFITVSLEELCTHIKGVAKKEGFRLYQVAEYPDEIMIQPYGGSKNPGNTSARSRLVSSEGATTYTISDGVTATSKPQFKVPLSVLGGNFTTIHRAKYATAAIQVYPTGAVVGGISATGSTSRESVWGIVSQELIDTVSPTMTRIDRSVVKALSKTANFNVGGIVKGYSTGMGLIRLDIDLGSYANVWIFLNDIVTPESGK